MKKIYLFLLIIISVFCFIGCGETEQPIDEIPQDIYYTVTFDSQEGSYIPFQTVLANNNVLIPETPFLAGYIFDGWYVDIELTNLFDFKTLINENLILYAKWEEFYYTVHFESNGGTEIPMQKIKKNGSIIKPEDPVCEGVTFLGWHKDMACTISFDFSEPVNKNMTLYARWSFNNNYFLVKYDLGDNLWINKDALFFDFMGDFYYFMNDFCDVDFANYGIYDLLSFLSFCKNWNAGDKSDLYGVGDAFSAYYVTQDTGGKLEDQPETTFIGYCYQNGKYLEFIPFLMEFFAYWRTDEGYTTPYNDGNDFFHSPWASLVDTAKFFYFTGNTLQTKYSWFNSWRVKNALDNIPGVLFNNVIFYKPEGFKLILPVNVTREGYIFLGWYDNPNFSGSLIYEVTTNMTVYAKWE